MPPNAMPAPPLQQVHRLLGHPTDLQGHLEVHGHLNVARRRGDSWRHDLADSLKESGLSGRGGAAFPTFLKLAVSRSAGGGGTLVVNAMEGEPASSKDSLLLTRVPHLVLDGAQYLATLCDSDRIVICVPIGRTTPINAVRHAVRERAHHRHARVREEIVLPPDRFVAGEESALTNWVDSARSIPTFRPDKSIPLRVNRRPALVHNAETLAHVALIARYGPGPFRARGMAEEPGTSLVTISGALAHSGVVEVDRGAPLWDIVERGAPVESIQALLVGGYGGAWVEPAHFGTPYASIPLRTIGAAAGVGVIVALGASSCGVAETARIARYMAGQSAGQCGPCVRGLPAIADDLARLARGQSDHHLAARLRRRLDEVDGRGACRHPDGVVNLVRSMHTVFATDVVDHARGRPCPSSSKPTVLTFPKAMRL